MSDGENSPMGGSNFADNSDTLNGNFLCGVVEGFYGRPWTPDQRKDLFAKMNKFGINAYLYAPKDDCKHRAFWRDLYSVEEAEQLISLISAARANNVAFFYALSPGLDISYSSVKELAFLKRKLEQVAQFGCQAFALLFDDIEPDMCEADKELFQSFAHAQVSVTNEVFQYLGQPQFLFCPTEYCTTRAVPNVASSEYLNTVGSKLLPGVDVMWTGSKVISKIITVQEIVGLTKVLHRPPVIWDNLHANDYDQKRVFLGPFSGRSPDLIPHLRGLLTNPNCEFEANFVAIHTLAQWSKCSVDGRRDPSINDSVSADIKLETESDTGSVEDIPSQISSSSYHPKHALRAAITDWLPEFFRAKSASGAIAVVKVSLPLVTAVDVPLPLQHGTVSTCISLTPATTTVSSSLAATTLAPGNGTIPLMPLPTLPGVGGMLLTESGDGIASVVPPPLFQPLSNPLMNSLVSVSSASPVGSPSPPSLLTSDSRRSDSTSGADEEDGDEPMDCVLTPSASPPNFSGQPFLGSGGERTIDNQRNPGDLTFEDVALLVDLFHLPFEHGSQGLQLLQEFHWLRSNAYVVSPKNKSDVQSLTIEAEEWSTRAAKFDSMSKSLCRLCQRLERCPNRSLFYDLNPYLWDMRGVVCLLNSYVKWLALGHTPRTVGNSYGQGSSYTWFSTGWKEAFMSGDQEPWVFRGGLTAELQRMLPIENINDLYMWKAPDVPCNKFYTIRPAQPKDGSDICCVCLKTCDDGLDGSEVFPEYPEIIGDKLVGGFLSLSPEFCFAVEDEQDTVCGYALAALDARQFYSRVDGTYMPDLRAKYPAVSKDSQEMLTPAEEVITGFHSYESYVPEVVYKHYPSLIKINTLPVVKDLSLVKKLLSCTLAALKTNGSYGAFCEVSVGDKNMVDYYTNLGFLEINLGADPRGREELLYFGRAF